MISKVFPVAVGAAVIAPVNQAKCDCSEMFSHIIQDDLPSVSLYHFLPSGKR